MKNRAVKFCVFAFFLLVLSGFGAKEVDAAEKIHFINVNGDATLIESDGHYALIDGGEDSDNPTHAPWLNLLGSEKHLLEYLHKNIPQQNGKIKLDFILGTHSHSDHLGGLRYVINDNGIEVEKVFLKHYNEQYMNKENLTWDNQEEYDMLVQAIQKKRIPIESEFYEESSRKFTFGNDLIQFFNTDTLNYPIESEKDKVDENTNSISTVITSKNGRRVFLGADSNDIPNPASPYGLEHELAKNIDQVDLMKLNHHGFRNSNSRELLDKLRPSYATLIGESPGWSFDKNTQKYLTQIETNVFICRNVGDIVTDFESETMGLEKYVGSLPIQPIKRRLSTPAMDEKFSGWKQHNGHWYFKEKGILLQGKWKTIGTQKYKFQNNGVMETGWQLIDGKQYLFDRNNGVMQTGWINEKGNWYWLQKDGAMATGWNYIDNHWYYLESNGSMVTGWYQINGHWYFFSDSGAMAMNWELIGGRWYYFGLGGAMSIEWGHIDDRWYYFEADGAMAIDWKQVDDHWYYFDSNGAMLTGWKLLGNTWYYLDGSGAMATGWRYVGGQWYYFETSGAMATGWKLLGSTWYYLDSGGAMTTGWKMIGGHWYFFYANGAMR